MLPTKAYFACKRLNLLRKASRLQVIQNSTPSVAGWRQCDIRIVEEGYEKQRRMIMSPFLPKGICFFHYGNGVCTGAFTKPQQGFISGHQISSMPHELIWGNLVTINRFVDTIGHGDH